MFDYPLPLRRGGLYEQLNLGPEATAEEISESRQEVASQLQTQQTSLRRRLERVYQQVDGLQQAFQRLKTLDEQGADADPVEYRRTQQRLTTLEEQATVVDPEFRSLREQALQVEQRIHEVNLMPLQNPEERLEYDRANPPFELLKLAACTHSPFDDSKVVLAVIRQEVSEFLVQAGESVYHPSDLTREDFTHDFAHDPTLDGPR
jgi:chromosome segregation ATPase